MIHLPRLPTSSLPYVHNQIKPWPPASPGFVDDCGKVAEAECTAHFSSYVSSSSGYKFLDGKDDDHATPAADHMYALTAPGAPMPCTMRKDKKTGLMKCKVDIDNKCKETAPGKVADDCKTKMRIERVRGCLQRIIQYSQLCSPL